MAAPDPAAGTGTSSRRNLVAVAAALVFVLIAAGVAVIVTRGDDQAGASVTLEPAEAPGDDPFTRSVAIGPVPTFPANVEAIAASTRNTLPTDPKTATLVATGTAPGLYGGTGETRSCDPEALVGFLEANEGKARAWAGVLGISVEDIEGYVAGLTPLVLTSDTLVGNHGFRDGEATTLTSVLQAGTAVMVDDTGTPRVKCNCGNPLTEAEPVAAPTSDAAWSGYSPNAVTSVRPGDPVTSFTVVDVETGDSYDEPVPGAGSVMVPGWVGVKTEPDINPNLGSASTFLVSEDGESWKETARVTSGIVTGIAYGDGQWIAMSNRDDGTGSQVYASKDLTRWNEVAKVPDELSGVAYGNGRWVAVGTRTVDGAVAGGTPRFVAVSYTSTDGTSWNETGLKAGTNASSIVPLAFGDGAWLTATGGFDPRGSGASDFSVDLYRSADGRSWDATGTSFDGFIDAALAHDGGTWNFGGAWGYGVGGWALRWSADTEEWTDATGALPNGDWTVGVMAAGDGKWLATVPSDSTRPITEQTTTWIFVSDDGKRWTPVGNGDIHLGAVARGPIPVQGTDDAPTADPSAACGPLAEAGVVVDALIPVTGETSAIDPTWGALVPIDPVMSFSVAVVRCTDGEWLAVYMDDTEVVGCPTREVEMPPADIKAELGLRC
jgi:hypothetical protein